MRIGAMAARKAGVRLHRNALTAALAIMVVCPVNAQAPTAHTRSTNRALQRPDAGMQGRPKPPAPPKRQWEALNAQGVEAYRRATILTAQSSPKRRSGWREKRLATATREP